MEKINKENKKRYDWLDIIKALCIISVVMFHIKYISEIPIVNTVWNYLDNISNLYKVTIFYCVAGITLNNEKLKNTFSFLFHKFKKLYLKVIIIGLFAVILHNVFINIGFYQLGFSYSGKVMNIYSTKDFLINVIYTFLLGNREVILGAFWFVYSLIICFIILAFIEFIINKIRIIKNKREFRLLITFILMFISICTSNIYGLTIQRFSNSLVVLFLLDMTNYLFSKDVFKKANIYVLLSCLICVGLAPNFGGISMNTNTITSPYFLLIIVFSSLYLLIFISKKIEKVSIL